MHSIYLFSWPDVMTETSITQCFCYSDGGDWWLYHPTSRQHLGFLESAQWLCFLGHLMTTDSCAVPQAEGCYVAPSEDWVYVLRSPRRREMFSRGPTMLHQLQVLYKRWVRRENCLERSGCVTFVSLTILCWHSSGRIGQNEGRSQSE
jgi:hypothetical protein